MIVPISISIKIGDITLNYIYNIDIPCNKEQVETIPLEIRYDGIRKDNEEV